LIGGTIVRQTTAELPEAHSDGNRYRCGLVIWRLDELVGARIEK
jgi:hypothetical protein